MGRFPIADSVLLNVYICRRCKARNKPGAEKCRKCGYPFLRPKKKEVAARK